MSRRISNAVKIDDVFDGLFPQEYRRRIIIMLRAFLDASMTFSQTNTAPTLTVAGFVGELQGWSIFQREWRKACRNAGINSFHMTDFEARKPPYDVWNDRKRAAVLSRLQQLISTTVLFGVSVTVAKADYEVLDKESKQRICGDNPYLLCASRCIGLVTRQLIQQKLNERVAYLFESGDKGQPAFIAAMCRLITASDKFKDQMRILTITAGNKVDFPAFDSADFLAWETAHYMPTRLGVEHQPVRSTIQRILDSVPIIGLYLSPTALRKMIATHSLENFEKFNEKFRYRPQKRNPKRPYTW